MQKKAGRCMRRNKWTDMIIELQSLAQAGLTYGRDDFDLERYARIRDIAAEMMSDITDIPKEKVRDLFCSDSGYQTPKIDTRAAIFKDGRILLVHERNGFWSLPGGWCELFLSVSENTVKEVREETGLSAERHSRPGKAQHSPLSIRCLQDLHSLPRHRRKLREKHRDHRL